MELPITTAMFAVLALLNIGLAVKTSVARAGADVWRGDGDNPALATRMRAHANFIENAPIAMALVFALEIQGRAPGLFVAIAATVFVVGRVLHPIGYIRADGGKATLRFVGVGLGNAAVVAMVVMLVLYGLVRGG